jgi:putative ABC transport system permease protein
MKAVGASGGDIKKIFLFESALIGILGGVIGVGVAIGLGSSFNFLLNLYLRSSGQHFDVFLTPPKFAMVMIAISMLISMFAGFYPTNRAQKLIPIDALRQ